MYKRIYDSEEIMVDYHNDGKPEIRVSQFEDNHFREEHFVELPVDVVEVVRCKDCKYWVQETDCDYCGHYGQPMWDSTADDFCSYGKRREEP